MRITARRLLVVSVVLNVVLLALPVAVVVQKGGVDYLLEKAGLRPPTFTPLEWQEDRLAWLATLPRREGDILLLGDSLVHEGRWAELFAGARDRGVGGMTVTGVLSELDRLVHPGASKVFVLAGTNDLSKEVAVGEVAAEYRKLLEELRRRCPKAKLHAISVPPVNSDVESNYITRGKHARIVELNAAIRRLCGELDVTFIDVHGPLADERGQLRREFTRDGLHLSAAGYEVVYKAVAPHMVAEATGDKR